MNKTKFITRLFASTMICGVAAIASPASAQDTSVAQPGQKGTTQPAPLENKPAPATPTSSNNTEQLSDAGRSATQAPGTGGDDTIVVTGTLFRTTATATPSPVSVVTEESLDRRGISTVQDAIQQLASNNGPALTNSFTANGAFAAGASAVSLRGLSTNSTLVLFDGLRAAYYPLADDGSRNFVDLNTIPDNIVDRIEVLRDGASSTYGADAIAGVVNIITKRQVKGVSMRAEGGVSSRGDAAQYRASFTAGVGDLVKNGINAYVGAFYYRSNLLKNNQRPYPFNTDDLRNVCNGSTCGPDNRVNAPNASGTFTTISTAANLIVRPFDATNTTAQGGYQNLGGNNCGGGQAVLNNNAVFPAVMCNYDYTNLYGVITPNIERFGVSARVTANLGGGVEGYGELNFLQSLVDYTGFPATIYGTAPTGIVYPQFRTSGLQSATTAPGSVFLTLPIYVCPERVNCSTSPNRKLNPNNPFAANNQVARIFGRIQDPSLVTRNETRTRAYRAAFGFRGNLWENWSFDVSATAMHIDLRRRSNGYVYIQHLLDVIADGTYNFVNPLANSATVQNYLTPENVVNASSDQAQVQANINTTVAQLPGGPLQVGVGVSARYEGVDAPSGNPDYNGPTQRYFTLNAFGTKGSREIYSAYGEILAPIVKGVELNASGRYDKYSSGQKAFSPKVGVKFTPIRQVVLRGTWSKGFRIPSFGEANALPTTGYVSNNSSLFNNAYLAQYGCTVATFSSCPVYIRSGSYGQTTLASPNLKPEKSRSFTAGILVEPIHGVSFGVDYYNIKKTGAITAPSNAPALQAYYQGLAIPAGYTVIPDAPDPTNPTAKPRVAFVQAQLVNANTIKVEGLDFNANVSFPLMSGVKLSSSLEASYIMKLETVFPDGTKERYDGTLGNFNLTAGSGTPKWHGTWLTTLDFKPYQLNATVNYFGGYNLSAMDQGTGYKDCGLNPGYSPSGCNIPAYVTFDLNAQFRVNDQFTFYLTMNNVFDKMPPIDVVTYGAHLYNPVQGGNGILGRYFKAGVRVNF